MSNKVFILLSLFDREEISLYPTLLIQVLNTSLFWREVAIHTHESCTSADVLVDKSFDQIHNALLIRFHFHVQKHAKFWIDISTETFEKPQMRR